MYKGYKSKLQLLTQLLSKRRLPLIVLLIFCIFESAAAAMAAWIGGDGAVAWDA